MVIGISGKKGSGKDLTGMIIQALTDKPTSFDGLDVITEEIVIEKVWGVPKFINKKFADKLKDFICALIGCTRKQLEDRDFKESPLPEEWWYYNMMGQLKMRGSYKLASDNKMAEERYLVKTTPRLLLQLMGTECGRNILHPNLWVMAVMAEYKAKNTLARIDTIRGKFAGTNVDVFPNWVITDMRFPNELEAVKKRGITIRIDRPHPTLGIVDYHPSETALDGADFDHTIVNDGSIKDLVESIKTILINEKIIKYNGVSIKNPGGSCSKEGCCD